MKTWLITGANRGLGLEIARSALEAGHSVVATARKPEQIPAVLTGYGDRLAAVPLDVTSNASVSSAVKVAVDRFGRIDVLVNNAGFGQLGFFEEVSSELVRKQFDTNVFGVFNVTRAVLPIMREQRSGHVVTISSICGIIGFDGASMYCATKFAVSGWSESLSIELARFGIRATCVHPGPFRTDFLDPRSVVFGDVSIDDYTQASQTRREALAQANHNQDGDPVKFGKAVVKLVESENPPVRWGAGTNALDTLLARADDLQGSALVWQELSKSTDIE
ncbi:short-chain dehydrogenase/reductase [Burkholderia sp. WAC0059]|uniref:oxidoreductase n=1 Tax=Burkholderia sp. WAC0059 TaxID=2066022 RepID=UPI000C7ED699|nr:oxidoreductase [Burkholderia sp. WAC0059]PLZ00404.1 short-chain dehydrogenase/reductase [Burkholderia sp. WAC0059]